TDESQIPNPEPKSPIPNPKSPIPNPNPESQIPIYLFCRYNASDHCISLLSMPLAQSRTRSAQRASGCGSAKMTDCGRTHPAGLYRPEFEHDACGVGFVAHIRGQRSHAIIEKGLEVLVNLLHRGACGCERNTGDGAGILLQMPDRFLRKVTATLG